MRSAVLTTVTALRDLPQRLRALPTSPYRCLPEAKAAALFTQLSAVSPYFAVSTGPIDGGGWYPVARLYTNQALLAAAVDSVAQRIGAPDRRGAVSTFHLGFAARLWSIGLGANAEHGMLPDLMPDQLWYSESNGTVRLHLPNPMAWQGDGLDSPLADMILGGHLTPLAEAVRRLGPISERLLRGNAASAVLGAARALNRHRGAQLATEPGWDLARALCSDERLTGTVRFNESDTDYRRTTCCLFYRTPGGGLCVDCALTHRPQVRQDRKRKGSI